MSDLKDYRPIAGNEAVDELCFLADKLRGTRITHVNSTAVGGGVAEILHGMVPLFNQLGVETDWQVIKGGEAFYAMTKKIHNGLHGQPETLTDADKEVYYAAQEENLKSIRLDADTVFIHDPQPAGLIKRKSEYGNRWVWRCHVDVSAPQQDIWDFLKPYVEQYDRVVFSSPLFARALQVPIQIISPSIDPLSEKNKMVSEEEVKAVMERLKIPTDRPLVTQVSRFDRLKDPVGLIRAFRLIQKECDARLLLVGGGADDDPEGAVVFAGAKEAAGDDPDIILRLLPPTSHHEINAIQMGSDIIVQKSLREGFGLTITEALWKGKPVIASAVGGIPLQILHQQTGLLVYSPEDTGAAILQLLKDKEFAARLGVNGREHVRRNFLLTRHLRDYLLLALSMTTAGQPAGPA